jgi:hypothetical protein
MLSFTNIDTVPFPANLCNVHFVYQADNQQRHMNGSTKQWLCWKRTITVTCSQIGLISKSSLSDALIISLIYLPMSDQAI